MNVRSVFFFKQKTAYEMRINDLISDVCSSDHQAVSYYVTKPADAVVADLGRFATTSQWYEGRNDPFGRSPAILTYDKEAGKIVDVEPRVWIAGMSDEGGGASWVAAAIKYGRAACRERVCQYV